MSLEIYEVLEIELGAILAIFVVVAYFIIMKNNKKEDSINLKPSVEESKFAYSIFVTSLQEYNEYYIAYELGKFLKVKDNELTEPEYNILCKRYISEYFKQTSANSSVITNVTYDLFGSHDELVMYLKRRFDMLLYKAYPQLGLNNDKIDFS